MGVDWGLAFRVSGLGLRGQVYGISVLFEGFFGGPDSRGSSTAILLSVFCFFLDCWLGSPYT